MAALEGFNVYIFGGRHMPKDRLWDRMRTKSGLLKEFMFVGFDIFVVPL